MASQKYIFETKDRNGIIVRLDRRTFDRHLTYHPEICNYVDEAKLTIEAPDVILVDNDNCHHHYRLGLGKDKFRKCYVQVLVYYFRRGDITEGKVASFWLTRNVGKGRLAWMKK